VEKRYSDAYQFWPDYDKSRETSAKEKLITELEGTGLTGIEILNQSSWEYFPHFDNEGIQKLYPWKLLEYQGSQKTWYIGSSACYESTEDVVSYNHLLIDLFLSK